MADPVDTDAPKVGIGCDRCHGRWEHDSMCPTGGAMTELDRLRERERLLFHNAGRQSMRAEKAEAEVDRLRFENTALADTINELAVLYEDQTGAPPHISTGVVEPNRG